MQRSFGSIINFGRLNTEEKGEYLGKFEAEDRLIVFYHDGNYEIADQELTQRFDAEKILLMEKFDPEKIITAVYLDNDKLQYNVKRFHVDTATLHTKFLFIKEGKNNVLTAVSSDEHPVLNVKTGRGQAISNAKFKIDKLSEVMGRTAVGAKLLDYNKSVTMEWVAPKEETLQQDLFE